MSAQFDGACDPVQQARAAARHAPSARLGRLPHRELRRARQSSSQTPPTTSVSAALSAHIHSFTFPPLYNHSTSISFGIMSPSSRSSSPGAASATSESGTASEPLLDPVDFSISLTLSAPAPPPQKKPKQKASKPEVKTKELSFRPSSGNYLAFLREVLLRCSLDTLRVSDKRPYPFKYYCKGVT